MTAFQTKPVSTRPTLLYGSQGGSTTPMLINNLDTANTVWIGDVSNVNTDGSNSVPLGPGQSLSFDGTISIYGVTQSGTVMVSIVPSGSSFFQPTTLSNIGGIQAFVQPTMPTGSSHPVNSIWFDEADQALFTWNGTDWVRQQFNADQLITAGTIVATLIAAGTIIAGIVDGTTIQGATIIATGTSGSVLAYNGTPTTGNLVLSFSPVAGVDPHSNPYGDGLNVFTSRAPGQLQLHVNPSVNAPAVDMFSQAVTESGHGSVYTVAANVGLPNEFINTWLNGPSSTVNNEQMHVVLTSAAHDLSSEATIQFLDNAAFIAYMDSQGTHFVKPVFGTSGVLTVGDAIRANASLISPQSTLTGDLAMNQNDFSFVLQTNITSFARICKGYPIPAGDASQQGTVYKITTFGSGLWEANPLTIQANFFGAQLGRFTIGGAFMASGTPFNWWLEVVGIISSPGTSGQVSVGINMSMSTSSGSNLLPGGPPNSTSAFCGGGTATGINTTVASNLTPQHQWTASNASQFLESIGSIFERLGPS